MCRYKVWTDNESAVDLMPHQEQYFNHIDDACDAASEYAHEYDGKTYRAIFHVEDLFIDETIDTYENEMAEEKNDEVSPLVPIIRNVLSNNYGIETSYLNDKQLELVLNEIEKNLVDSLKKGFDFGNILSKVGIIGK